MSIRATRRVMLGISAVGWVGAVALAAPSQVAPPPRR